MLLHHRQYSGAGEPLLILHGLYGNQANWGWHASRLAERFAVYGLDLRNHGASPHDDHMSYPAMAEDVQEWMRANGMANCHLLGHSMGGKVAMQLAFAEPSLVRKLVVVDIAPVDYREALADTGHPALIAAIGKLPVERLKSRSEADTLLREKITDARARSFLLTNLERMPQGGYRWRLNLAAIRDNLSALTNAPKASGPYAGTTLFLFGEQSVYRQIKHQAQILRLFPAAELQSVPEAGHWLHVEQPQACLEAVQGFLLKSGD